MRRRHGRFSDHDNACKVYLGNANVAWFETRDSIRIVQLMEERLAATSTDAARATTAPIWFRPVMAPMFRDRKLAACITIGLSLQLCAGIFRLPGMPCPTLTTLGFPCPGCGGTRASAALLKGEWTQAVAMHAYAPVFLVAVVLFALSALLPKRPREWMIDKVEAIECRTGLTNLLLIVLLLYWLGRLACDGAGFVRLVAG